MVTRAQLLDAGVAAGAIKTRVRNGALLVAHRGVYRVGHRAPSIEARYMAAVLACGKGSLLSGPAAAFLYGLLRGSPQPPEVTSPTQRRAAGIVMHHARHVDPRDATRYRDIPVTTIPRTIVDLAATLPPDQLARTCHEADVRYGVEPDVIDAVLSRRPTSAGAAKLRRVVHGDVRITLSKLERRFLDLLRAGGLTLPVTNRPAGTRRVDCRWPDRRLTVELDGYRYHRSRHAWEQDRRREREAHARGDHFRRYTYGDVFEDPRQMLTELRGLLPAA